METTYLGIDMAAQTFDAAVWRTGQTQRLGHFANTPAGFQACAQALAALGPAAAIWLIVEPTGGYEQGLVSFALEQAWQISLPNPRQVRAWIKGQGGRAKTDPLDAAHLAAYGAQRQPPHWHPLPPAVQTLDDLLARQADLEESLRQERNRQASAARRGRTPAVAASFSAVLAALEAALAALQAAITEHLQQQPDLQAQVRLLRTVPGVGAKTVLPLLVLLTRWHTLTTGQGLAKGLVAFVGLDPQTTQSGTSLHAPARISRMGNKQVRRWLFMAALGGKRGHNCLRDFFDRLVGRGKPKMVALVAAMRKLLIWAWAVFRQQTPFDPTRAARRAPSPAAQPVPA
jgi:transposase